MRGLFQLAVVCQALATVAYGQFGFGGGMGGGFGMGGMGMMGNIAQYFGHNSFLARAVRDIVHPNAVLTQPIMQIAMRHRGPPSTRARLLGYMPHFVDLGFQHDVKPNGTIGQPSYQAMEQHMIEQTIKWMNTSRRVNPTEMNNMNEWLTNIRAQRSSNQNSIASVSNSTTVGGITGRIAAPLGVSESANHVAVPSSIHGSVNPAWGQFGFGGGMGGGFGMGGMGMMGNIAQYFGHNSFLARAVRDIVHPNAVLTQPIMQIAMRRGPPSTRARLLEYMPHFVDLGFQHGVKPNGTIGQPSYQAMEQHMIEQTIKWMNTSRRVNPTEMNNMNEWLTNIRAQRSSNQNSTASVSNSTTVGGITGRIAAPLGVSENQVAAPSSIHGSVNQGLSQTDNVGPPLYDAVGSYQPNSFLDTYMMLQNLMLTPGVLFPF